MRKLILQLLMCIGLCGISHAQSYNGPYDGYNTPLVRGDIWKRIPGLDKNGNVPLDGVSASYLTSVKVVQPGQVTPDKLPLTLTISPQASFTEASVSITSYAATGVTSVVTPSNCIDGAVFTYVPTNTKVQYVKGNPVIVDGGSASQAQVPLGSVQLTSTDSNCTPPTVSFMWGVGSVAITNAGLGVPRTMSIADSVSGAVIGFTTDTQVVQMSSILGDAFIPKTWIGESSGVAGLNALGEMTNPFNVEYGTVSHTYTASDGTTSNFTDIVLNNDKTTNITVGPEAVTFGGITNADGVVSHKNVIKQGMPYGPYELGCVDCTFSSADDFNGSGSQAAISGIDYRSGASAIANGDMATVMTYRGFVNQHVRFTETAASYTANTVTLAQPMTTAEMSQIKYGMYITTNSVDPSCTTAKDSVTGVYNDCRIRGVVSSWTPTVITVFGWGRMGGSTSGVTPSTTSLDTVYTTTTTPKVFVGGGGKSFASNDYLAIDASKAYGLDGVEETTNNFEALEQDVRISNVTTEHPYLFHGHTLSFQCIPCSAPVNPDSYGYLVNGPGLGRAFVAQMDGNALEYSGYSTWLPGNGYPTATGANHIMFDFDSSLSTNNNLHFGAQVVKSLDDSSSWADWEVRLGLNIDGTRTKDVMSGGSNMSQLVWNHSGASGSLSILTPSGNVGLSQDSSGNVNFNKLAYFQPSVVSNNLIPAFMACDSYTICTAGNTGANISILASGFEAVKEGTGSTGFPTTSTKSILSPDGSGNWTTTGSFTTSGSLKSNDLKLSSAGYNSDGTVSGQGLLEMWNTLALGSAYTEIVNVDPVNSGGIKFYNTTTGNKPSDSDAIVLMNNAGLLDYKNMTINGNTYLKGSLIYSNSVNNNAFYWSLSSDGKTLSAGTQVSGGANIDGVNNLSVSSLNASETLSAKGSLVIPFGTPASSTATCTQGQLEMDATYIYSCVATNTWNRLANGSTW